MHGYLSAGIICSEKRTVFRERTSKENCELLGTDNVQGQISLHIFEAKWRLLRFINLFTRPHFGRPFLKAFKSNSVGAQNIVSLFKMFSSSHFNNLLGIKTKRANVNREDRKLGKYHI